jgi:hypothetical protein
MAGVATDGWTPDAGTAIALVSCWRRETTPNASSAATIRALDTLDPPLLTIDWSKAEPPSV